MRSRFIALVALLCAAHPSAHADADRTDVLGISQQVLRLQRALHRARRATERSEAMTTIKKANVLGALQEADLALQNAQGALTTGADGDPMR